MFDGICGSSFALVMIAVILTIASLFVPYTGMNSLQNPPTCSGQEPTIDYCALDIALPSLAIVFGFLFLFPTISTLLGIGKNIVIPILGAFSMLSLSVVFSAAALGTQITRYGVNEMTYQNPDKNQGAALSLASFLMFFMALLVNMGIFKKSFGFC